jgi:N-acetyl-anhydromuramyl-L-alanine amidase AmpD
VSYNFIHPWETWKNNVKLKNISNTNYIYKKDTALFDVLKMQNILQEKMREYGYKISNQILQKIFDLWIK